MSFRRLFFAGLLLLLSCGFALAVQPIRNWPAPPTWIPPRPGFGARVIQSDIANPLPFVPINPCRMLDTRSSGVALASGSTLDVTLTGPPCGIPTGAAAVSANFAVFNITGTSQNGMLLVYPTGSPSTAQPMVNWSPTSGQIDNASAVPLGAGGAVTVQPNQGAGTIDLVIDVNGYYAETPALISDPFRVVNSGQYAIYGETSNTGTQKQPAAAVYGRATAPSGVTYGVWGDDFSTSEFGIGVLGISHATTGRTYGVFGQTNSTSIGAVGVYGEAVGTGGGTYGVYGFETSLEADSAGVRGVDYGGPVSVAEPGLLPVGVRGESKNGAGVVGISQNLSGVIGAHLSPAGLTLTQGVLGGPTVGIFYENGLAGTGTKSFVEPHPTDASKVIRYVSLEGPEAGTYFRGTDQIHHGMAVIQVPESFRLVTDTEGLTVHVTPIGAPTTMYVVSRDLDQIVVHSSRDVKFDYMVHGVRKAYPHWTAIQDNETFFVPESASDRLPVYLSEEERSRLIRNGTYNADGTVNMETAERVGWTKIWAERKAREREAAAGSRQTAVER